MKLLKYLGVLILALIVLFGIISFVIPKSVDLTLDKTIDAPIELVSRNLQDFSLWQDWVPLINKDKSLVIELGDPYSKSDASAQWSSAKAGSGGMRMEAFSPNDSLDVLINTNNNGWIKWGFNLSPENGKTKISNHLSSELSRPLNVLTYFQKSAMLRLVDKALSGLEAKCVKESNEGLSIEGSKVFVTIWPETQIQIKKDSISLENARSFFLESFKVFGQEKNSEHSTQFNAYGLFYNKSKGQDRMVCIAGVEMSNDTDLGPSESLIIVPSQRALKTSFKGSLEEVSRAHSKLKTVAEELDLVLSAPIIEHYKNINPSIEAIDAYLIDVYYLIRD